MSQSQSSPNALSGALSALQGEYERALKDLYHVLESVSTEELLAVVDPETKDEDCRSIQSILSHVVSSGKNYAVYIRKSLGESVHRFEKKELDNPEAYLQALKEMFAYNQQLFQDHPQLDLSREVKIPWSQTYDGDQLLEHAIMHILRHRRQIEGFLKKLRASHFEVRTWPEGLQLPLDLLWEADPSQKALESYLSQSQLFGLFAGEKTIGICAFLPLDNTLAEVKNISIRKGYQGQGLGKRLLSHVIKEAQSQGFEKLRICTATSGLVQQHLYQKSGFRPVAINLNYFVEHYPEPMFEDGLQVRDQVVMEKNLLE